MVETLTIPEGKEKAAREAFRRMLRYYSNNRPEVNKTIMVPLKVKNAEPLGSDSSEWMIITQKLINMLLSWRHSGFNVFCGPRIHPREKDTMENLARYIIRASFSQEWMTYIRWRLVIAQRNKIQ